MSEQPDRERALQRLESFTRILDSSLPVPGTGYSFGLDPIIGLIPAIGDSIGGLVSGLILVQLAYLGAPKRYLIRMFWNLVVDAVLGAVPVAGDLIDLGWKANQRNLALARTIPEEAWLPPRDARRIARLVLGATLLLVLLVAVVTTFLLRLLYQAITG